MGLGSSSMAKSWTTLLPAIPEPPSHGTSLAPACSTSRIALGPTWGCQCVRAKCTALVQSCCTDAAHSIGLHCYSEAFQHTVHFSLPRCQIHSGGACRPHFEHPVQVVTPGNVQAHSSLPGKVGESCTLAETAGSCPRFPGA